MIGPKAQTVMSVTDFHPSQSPLGPPNPCSIVMATKPPKEFADESSVGDMDHHSAVGNVSIIHCTMCLHAYIAKILDFEFRQFFGKFRCF